VDCHRVMKVYYDDGSLTMNDVLMLVMNIRLIFDEFHLDHDLKMKIFDFESQ